MVRLLKEIKIYNFGPINQPICFSLEKRKTEQFLENIIEGSNLLKTIYIYGANNSGKTKVVETIRFLKDIVELGKEIFNKRNYLPFLFNSDKVTELEYSFIIEGCKYLYLLRINLFDKYIVEEKMTIGSKVIFIRKNETLSLEENRKELKIDRDIFGLVYYYSVIGGNEDIDKLIEYINQIIYIEQQRNSDNIIKANSITDINKINFLEENIERINDVIKGFGFDFETVILKGTDQVNREIKSIGVNKKFKNQNLIVPLSLFESFGTNVFINLLLEVEKNQKSQLIVIDEIERGIHFALASAFIGYINREYPNKQLVLPTHMTDLLDSELKIRKDQIYIVENELQKGFSINRKFSKKVIRETMNFQKIFKSKSVGGVPEISLFENSDVK